MSDPDLAISESLTVPAAELEWIFTTSGGPGGQHANRAATKVELRWRLAGSRVLDDEAKQKLMGRLGTRAAGGVVAVVVDESRSQWRNRQLARRRLADLVAGALAEERPRIPTKVPRGARQRRRRDKERRSETKRLRRPPESD